MMVAPSLRKTSSNAPVNWPAPSRIKNRIARPIKERRAQSRVQIGFGYGSPRRIR
jgi:hypothetical protein